MSKGNTFHVSITSGGVLQCHWKNIPRWLSQVGKFSNHIWSITFLAPQSDALSRVEFRDFHPIHLSLSLSVQNHSNALYGDLKQTKADLLVPPCGTLWMRVNEIRWKWIKVVESVWNIQGATRISDVFFEIFLMSAKSWNNSYSPSSDCGHSYLRGFHGTGGIECEGYTYIMKKL